MMMVLKIGKTPHPVESFADASALWRRVRDENGWGASQSPRVTLVDGEKRYHVSYNGKVWKDEKWTPASEPLYDPFEAKR